MRVVWKVDTRKCVDASPVLVCENGMSSVCAVVGSHSGDVVRVNAADGSEVWRTSLPDRVEGSAVLAGQCLVVGVFWSAVELDGVLYSVCPSLSRAYIVAYRKKQCMTRKPNLNAIPQL